MYYYYFPMILTVLIHDMEMPMQTIMTLQPWHARAVLTCPRTWAGRRYRSPWRGGTHTDIHTPPGPSGYSSGTDGQPDIVKLTVKGYNGDLVTNDVLPSGYSSGTDGQPSFNIFYCKYKSLHVYKNHYTIIITYIVSSIGIIVFMLFHSMH